MIENNYAYPLISIIVPTFNRADLIGETIQSVLNQSYNHWELIVIDDGSVDNTEDVVSKFVDTRIHYFLIEHNGIFGKVRNEGLKKAKGEYVAFLDSDDLWSTDKLLVQVNLMTQYPDAAFVFNNITIFGTRPYPSPPDYDELYVGSILLSMLEETRFVFYPSALMFKRTEVIEKLGYMDEKLLYGTDTKYFLNMCQYFTGIFTNKRLVQIRRHEHSTTERYHTSEVFLDSINIAKAIYESKSITRLEYKRILGHYYYKKGLAELLSLKRPKEAMHSFYSCILVAPLRWRSYARLIHAFLISLRAN
ncbi:glycosyltransferase family 2 protein [Chryseolinea sp. H1M3-3]|uniref:glycosyltransferase family 2 protein n=1 Tax=Chryseolinea sp. H1M3-3 TaxID=3034144 RepID=UPI0023ED7455|nr:glycosyltransferase family 2 protein [Chryseolinea sp. H1M3-3]